jgi:dolichyl-phosphate-mannose-protein mannosyltransferase
MTRARKPKRGRVNVLRTPAAPAGTWPRPAYVAGVLVCFAVLFAALAINSYTRASATFDEAGHLAAGYAAVARRDYRVDIEHPPVVRMWAALPLLGIRGLTLDTTDVDRATPVAVAFGGPFELGHRFLFKDNDADRLLNRARFMTVLLGVVLGLLVFCWAGEWLGFRPAVAALVLYTCEPNIAAHSSLATTDVGVTCLMFGTVYLLWRTSRNASAGNVIGVAVCCALAVLSKFSALVLGPVVLLLMTVAARRRRAFSRATFIAVPTLIVLVTWIAAWAVYGFRYAPSASDRWLFALQDHPAVRQAVPRWAAIVGWIDAHRLLPNALSQGFLHGQALVQGRPAFLAGEYSNFGWWYYFPAAFLMKTPLVLLALFAVGAIICLKELKRGDAFEFVVLPIGVVMIWAMTSALNIGLRHILPIYPFVIMIAAAAARPLASAQSRRSRLLLAVLLIAGISEYASAYPNSLTFFNIAAGGPHAGYRYLADSNIDWGQDLKRLKAWMDGHGVRRIGLAYFGTADPAYYGIDCMFMWGTTVPGVDPVAMGPPQLPGYVAISTTLLDGVPFGERARDFYEPLRESMPAADLGSIRIYRVEQPWWGK